MSTLTFTRSGHGAPLLLLHGLGLSRQSWDPVMATLADQFDVLAVDLPGFGSSPPLPPGVEPHPAALASSVAELLDELDFANPSVVGNSLGGWVALELARLRSVASLTLLSPAGLWAGGTPTYCLISLRASRWLARHATGPLSRILRFRLGRLLVFGQTHGRPFRIKPAYARAVLRGMAASPGFDATLQATADRHYFGPSSDVPVTIAFGTRDWLLRKRQSRHLEALPANTRVASLPGCGHIPMADDPSAVAALISDSAVRHQRPLFQGQGL
jgi:pimeloyl-ACP methyl ester carboxylesterase